MDPESESEPELRLDGWVGLRQRQRRQIGGQITWAELQSAFTFVHSSSVGKQTRALLWCLTVRLSVSFSKRKISHRAGRIVGWANNRRHAIAAQLLQVPCPFGRLFNRQIITLLQLAPSNIGLGGSFQEVRAPITRPNGCLSERGPTASSR